MEPLEQLEVGLVRLKQEPSDVSVDEEEEFIAQPSYSLSRRNQAESSPMIKQGSLVKMKRMLVPKKGSTKFKSKAKQVISHECRKSSSKKKRTSIEELYDNDEAKLSVFERAEEVLDNIGDECPSFVKCMLPSNVSHGFWLIFPKKFCSLYLPMHDATITLVDECGKEYETNYIADRHGLSGGWRGFSLAHRILKGDLLVLKLIKPCTLKVHIVRVYGLDEVDAALCLMNIVTCTKRTYPAKKMRGKRKRKKSITTLLQCKDYRAECSCKNDLLADRDDNLESKVLDGSNCSEFSKGSCVNRQQQMSCDPFEAHGVLQVAEPT